MKSAAAAIVAIAVVLASAAAPAADPPPRLTGYSLAVGPVAISNVTEDASGVAYCPDTHLLYVVQNGPCTVAVTDTNGVYKGKIALGGFEDVEDLTSVGGRRFAVVEERRRNLVLIEMPDPGGRVPYADCPKAPIEPEEYGNSGLEGVACDATGGQYWVVKEKQPRRIYHVTWNGREPATIRRPWDLEAQGMGMSDVSAIFFDAETGRLLILSDESRCVVECTRDGKEVARLSLRAGQAGLKADLKQPEGLCLDPAGNLYVVCEPNLLYVFRKAAAQ